MKKNKETKAERDWRIKETENGRRYFQRVVPNKKRDSKNKLNKENCNGEE